MILNARYERVPEGGRVVDCAVLVTIDAYHPRPGAFEQISSL